MLVLVGLGAPIADVILEVSLSDELLNLVFEGDAFFRGVADVSVKSAIFILVLLRAASLHRSGRLYMPVCSVAKNTSSHDLVRSVKLLYLLGGGLGTL